MHALGSPKPRPLLLDSFHGGQSLQHRFTASLAGWAPWPFCLCIHRKIFFALSQDSPLQVVEQGGTTALDTAGTTAYPALLDTPCWSQNILFPVVRPALWNFSLGKLGEGVCGLLRNPERHEKPPISWRLEKHSCPSMKLNVHAEPPKAHPVGSATSNMVAGTFEICLTVRLKVSSRTYVCPVPSIQDLRTERDSGRRVLVAGGMLRGGSACCLCP